MFYIILTFLSINSWALDTITPDNLNILREQVTHAYQREFEQPRDKKTFIAELKLLYPANDHADIDLFAQELPNQIRIPLIAHKNTLSYAINQKQSFKIEIESVFYSKIKFNNYSINLAPYKTFKDQLKYLQRVLNQHNKSLTAQTHNNIIPWSWLWEQHSWANQCSWIQKLTDQIGLSQCQKNQVLAALFKIIQETGIPEHCSGVRTTKATQEKLITCILNATPNLTQLYLKIWPHLKKEKLEITVTCQGSKSEFAKRNGGYITVAESNKIRKVGGDCCSYQDEKEKAACVEIINQFKFNDNIQNHLQKVVAPNQGGVS